MLRISGSARAILTAERVALNFVQHLSGIATLTAQFVAAVKGTRAQILDTRKTTPGWRRFEKYAVACGGGESPVARAGDTVLTGGFRPPYGHNPHTTTATAAGIVGGVGGAAGSDGTP